MSVEIAQLQQIKNLVNEFKEYTVFSKVGSSTINTQNVYETALSISGKGFLSKALVYKADDTSGIRITVDGVVKHLSQSTVANGILQENFILLDSTNVISAKVWNSVIELDNFFDYPYTLGLGRCVALSAPINFSSSLLIEVVNTTRDFNVFVDIAGATY